MGEIRKSKYNSTIHPPNTGPASQINAAVSSLKTLPDTLNITNKCKATQETFHLSLQGCHITIMKNIENSQWKLMYLIGTMEKILIFFSPKWPQISILLADNDHQLLLITNTVYFVFPRPEKIFHLIPAKQIKERISMFQTNRMRWL